MLAYVSLRRSLDWFAPVVLALGAGLLLAFGFFIALTGRFGQPLAPMPARAEAAPRSGAYHIVALGDSITQGVGDPARGGYAARVAEALRTPRRPVLFTNLALAGDETADLLRAIDSPEARPQLQRADLLVISAGGNDLTHALRALTGEQTREPEAVIERARANLRAALARLRALNPTAAIRLLGLYNPFEVLPAEAEQARAQLLEWNTAIEQATLAYDNVLVVPVADAFAGRPDRLAGDHYHPGARGHAIIAERVLATLPEADAPESQTRK
jgi:lysophospholipase L1-like esterase